MISPLTPLLSCCQPPLYLAKMITNSFLFQSGLSRKTKTIGYICVSMYVYIYVHTDVYAYINLCTYKFTYPILFISFLSSVYLWFKELAHTVEGLANSKISRTDQQAINSDRSRCCSLEVEFLKLWEIEFLLFRPSTIWMKPTYIIESNLLFLKTTDCEC